jgi:hypothetical protein
MGAPQDAPFDEYLVYLTTFLCCYVTTKSTGFVPYALEKFLCMLVHHIYLLSIRKISVIFNDHIIYLDSCILALVYIILTNNVSDIQSYDIQ